MAGSDKEKPGQKRVKSAGKAKPGKPGGKGDAAKAEEVEPERIEEYTKEFYLLQISDLKEKLDRQHSKCGLLEREVQELKASSRTKQTDLEDIIEHLRRELTAKSEDLLSLKEKLQRAEQEAEKTKEELDGQLKTQKDTADAASEKLTKELAAAQEELDDLHDFKLQKTAITHELEEEKRLRAEESAAADEAMTVQVREHSKERERLRRELEERHDEVLRLHELALKQTKSLKGVDVHKLSEADQMLAELVFQSKQSQLLVKENNKVRAANQQLKQKLELFDQIEHDLAIKNRQQASAMSTLTLRLQETTEESGARLNETKTQWETERQQLRSQLDELVRTNGELTRLTEKLQIESSSTAAERQWLRSEADTQRMGNNEAFAMLVPVLEALKYHSLTLRHSQSASPLADEAFSRADALADAERKLQWVLTRLRPAQFGTSMTSVALPSLRPGSAGVTPSTQRDEDGLTATAAAYLAFAAPLRSPSSDLTPKGGSNVSSSSSRTR